MLNRCFPGALDGILLSLDTGQTGLVSCNFQSFVTFCHSPFVALSQIVVLDNGILDTFLQSFQLIFTANKRNNLKCNAQALRVGSNNMGSTRD